MSSTISIVRVKHGSHLYGTSTPASDTDYKSVHIPSAEAIVLQRAENVIDRKVKLSATLKNQAGDVDDQSYSLQKFLGMLAAGDTVATEILFAKPEQTSTEWEHIQALRPKLLNRQCKGFVGYCRRQAAKYGIKGSRMGAVKAVLDFLEIVKLGLPTATARLSDIEAQLHDWSAGREHVMWENIPSPNGSDMWHLNVCDRKMPMTVRIEDAYAVWAKVWENYGDRARAAMTNEGIDWKAVSHAVRVARQAIELLETGHLTFPRPDAEELLAIKLGQIPYSEVSPLLEQLVERVEEVSLTSVLPEDPDLELHDLIVKLFYLEQVRTLL